MAMTEKLSDERLAMLVSGLGIWIKAGRSAAPDLDRDTHAALTELQSLRAPSIPSDGEVEAFIRASSIAAGETEQCVRAGLTAAAKVRANSEGESS